MHLKVAAKLEDPYMVVILADDGIMDKTKIFSQDEDDEQILENCLLDHPDLDITFWEAGLMGLPEDDDGFPDEEMQDISAIHDSTSRTSASNRSAALLTAPIASRSTTWTSIIENVKRMYPEGSIAQEVETRWLPELIKLFSAKRKREVMYNAIDPDDIYEDDEEPQDIMFHDGYKMLRRILQKAIDELCITVIAAFSFARHGNANKMDQLFAEFAAPVSYPNLLMVQ